MDALLDELRLVFGGKLLGWGTGFFFLPEVDSSIEDSLESDTFNLGLGTGNFGGGGGVLLPTVEHANKLI